MDDRELTLDEILAQIGVEEAPTITEEQLELFPEDEALKAAILEKAIFKPTLH